MNINKELNSRLISQSENDIHHEEYNNEFGFYSNIVRGDIKAVKNTFCDPTNIVMYDNSKYGKLSADKMRNIRYHFIVSTVLITRFCADNDLERELAYTLSDLYIFYSISSTFAISPSIQTDLSDISSGQKASPKLTQA